MGYKEKDGWNSLPYFVSFSPKNDQPTIIGSMQNLDCLKELNCVDFQEKNVFTKKVTSLSSVYIIDQALLQDVETFYLETWIYIMQLVNTECKLFQLTPQQQRKDDQTAMTVRRSWDKPRQTHKGSTQRQNYMLQHNPPQTFQDNSNSSSTTEKYIPNSKEKDIWRKGFSLTKVLEWIIL